MSSTVYNVDLIHKSKAYAMTMVFFTSMYWEAMASKFPSFWEEDFYFFFAAVLISGLALLAQWFFFVNWYNKVATNTSHINLVKGMMMMVRCATGALLANRSVDFVITYFTGKVFEHMRSIHLMMLVSLLMNALSVVMIVPNLVDRSNHPAPASSDSQPPPSPAFPKNKKKKDQ